MKECTKCKQHKKLEDFHDHAKGAQGKHSICKVCRRLYNRTRWHNFTKEQRELKRKKKTPETIWKSNRTRVASIISYNTYTQLLGLQNNSCAICHRTDIVLCVDHDHITNKVRGLLCKKCNLVLGCAADNIEILNNSIKYLESYNSGNRQVC